MPVTLPPSIAQELRLIVLAAESIDDDARARYLQALAAGGPLDDPLRRELRDLCRAEMARAQADVAEDERRLEGLQALASEERASAEGQQREALDRLDARLRGAVDAFEADAAAVEREAFAEIEGEAGQADAAEADAIRASLKAKA